MSRIGKQPVTVPAGVDVTIDGNGGLGVGRGQSQAWR